MDIHGKIYIHNKSKIIIIIYYYIKSSNNIIYLFFMLLYYYKYILDNFSGNTKPLCIMHYEWLLKVIMHYNYSL